MSKWNTSNDKIKNSRYTPYNMRDLDTALIDTSKNELQIDRRFRFTFKTGGVIDADVAHIIRDHADYNNILYIGIDEIFIVQSLEGNEVRKGNSPYFTPNEYYINTEDVQNRERIRNEHDDDYEELGGGKSRKSNKRTRRRSRRSRKSRKSKRKTRKTRKGKSKTRK